MDRKEEILQTFSDINYAYNNCTKYDTLNRMLDELAESCDDAISRQAVLDVIEREMFIGDAISEIEKLPSVTPKQKMGRWIAVEDEEMNTVGYFCSECDLPLETEERTPFCPNCGAKMEESE